jgi:lysophospholipase
MAVNRNRLPVMIHKLVGAIFAGFALSSLYLSPAFAVKEDQLLDFLDEEIIPFYDNNCTKGTFKGKDDILISYAKYEVPDEKGAIIIVPGRKEFALKYSELLYDFKDSGYSLYIFDHRGQGSSGRLLKDHTKGHVVHFNDYVADFKKFMTDIVNQKQHWKRFVVCHSMGGVIASFYASSNPHTLDGMILCSPMMGIRTPKGADFITSFSAVFLDSVWLGSLAVPMKKYFLPDYPFEKNFNTHSPARYEVNRILLKKDETLFVGAPTYRWVREAMDADKVLQKQAEKVALPVLILQAEKDMVVTAKHQTRFCEKAPDCTLQVIQGAKHEILMEKDSIRDKALTSIIDFLDRYSSDSNTEAGVQ